MTERELKQTLLVRAKRVPILSGPIVVCLILALFLAAALLPELNAERYGAPSFLAVVPGLMRGAALIGPLHVLSVAIACLLLIDLVGSHSGTRANSELPTQLKVWAPYAAVWILSTLFGAVSGVENYAWISLAIVLGVAALRLLSLRKGIVVALVVWSTRLIVCGSLVLGVLDHARAFAPYMVWPGGWWVGVDRLQGLLPHPNTLGWVAAVSIVVEIYCARRGTRAITVAAAVCALLLTGSRTATIALVVGLACGLFHRTYVRGAQGRLTVVALAVVGLVLSVAVILQTGISLSALNGREATWIEAVRAFGSNWIMGSGPGAYAQSDSSVAFVAYAHNQILQTAAESGLFGILGLVLHVGYLVSYVRRYANTSFGVILATMWLTMFLTENLLRFAGPSFVLQIVVFQLALYAAASLSTNAPLMSKETAFI